MTKVKLSDICRIKYGKDHKKLNDGNIPVFGSGGIVRYADAALSNGPSVLIPRKGTLGNLFYADKPFWTVDTLFWTEIDTQRVHPKYLYYTLKNKNLAALNIGTAVPSLSVDVLNEIELDLPKLEVQSKVVYLLNLLDGKIDLNNQINDYLAKLVSLEFEKQFGANTPAVDLSNVLDISTKTVKPQDYMEEIWEHYSIPAFDEARWPAFEPANKIKSNKYVIDENCILISKLNPSIKRLWIPPCITSRSVCSTEFIVYKPKKPEYKSFYNAAIDSDSFSNYLLQHVTGSTGSRQRSQPKATLTYPIPNPDEKQIAFFCAFADPIYNQIRNNEIECQKLKTLRDLLLPKLVTGEINSSVIDIM